MGTRNGQSNKDARWCVQTNSTQARRGAVATDRWLLATGGGEPFAEADAGTCFGHRPNAPNTVGYSEEVVAAVFRGGSEAEQRLSAAVDYTVRRWGVQASLNLEAVLARQAAMMVARFVCVRCSVHSPASTSRLWRPFSQQQDSHDCFKQTGAGLGGTGGSLCDEGLATRM